MTPSANGHPSAAAAWQGRADELAAWALDRLFVRTDRYGGYRAGGTLTKPAAGPVPGCVNRELLARHFRGAGADGAFDRGVIVGAHALDPADSTGLWVCLDIDAHDGTGADPDANRRFALHVYARLTALGFRVLLLSSNGNGGFHLWVLFSGRVPGSVLRAFGLWSVRGHVEFGLPQPEVFPKQDAIPADGYGNWARVPGRHHTRDHWAEAWDGSAWAGGAAAVALILALAGDDPRLVPLEALEGDDGGAEPVPPASPDGGDPRDRPGDEFNRRGTWAEAGLFDAGGAAWERRADGERGTVTRPGKDGGSSGTVGLVTSRNNGWPLFRCFSTNWPPFRDRSYNRFAVFALLRHGEDYAAAARDLRRRGYGTGGSGTGTFGRGGPGGRDRGGGRRPAAADAADDPGRLRPGEQWDDPHRLARMLDAKYRHGDERTLIGFRSEYLVWDRGGYGPRPDADLAAEVAAHCRGVFEDDYPVRVKGASDAAAAAGKESAPAPKLFKVTTTSRGNVLANLAGLVTVPDRGADPPMWIGDVPDDCPPADGIVAAPNGLFRLDDVAAGLPPFALPTPRFFTRNPLPFPVDPAAPVPALWLSSLDQWFPNDPDTVAGLQEWFGYLLTTDTRMHKILLLVGPPRSGKGTILRVLAGLVGRYALASMTFAALGESFALEALLGKTVCVVPDARLSGRSDTAHVVERLLSISGGDEQTVNRKNKPRITTTLNTRFVVATNEVPRLPDASGAMATRFHILHTPVSFLGREDRSLAGKLAAELPGVLRWAAEGWVRLQGRIAGGNGFTPNAAASAFERILADLSSPVRAFVRECCTVGPREECERGELYAAWKRWNEEQNREPTSQPIFGKDLKAAFPHVTVGQPWRGGTRVRLCRGIGLRSHHQWGEPVSAQAGTSADPTSAWREGENTHSTHHADVSPAPVPACAADEEIERAEREGVAEFGGG